MLLMTTSPRKRRAKARDEVAAGVEGAQPEAEGGAKSPHPDPLPHAGEGEEKKEGESAEAASQKPPVKKRVYPPKNRPRVDAETLRKRALRGNDPPAVEAPAADSSHLPAARGRVIGRPVRAPA